MTDPRNVARRFWLVSLATALVSAVPLLLGGHGLQLFLVGWLAAMGIYGLLIGPGRPGERYP